MRKCSGPETAVKRLRQVNDRYLEIKAAGIGDCSWPLGRLQGARLPVVAVWGILKSIAKPKASRHLGTAAEEMMP